MPTSSVADRLAHALQDLLAGVEDGIDAAAGNAAGRLGAALGIGSTVLARGNEEPNCWE